MSESPTRTTSKNSADAVLAATAGLDNWKTWAGRQTGSDDFEWLDLWRGAKRSLQYHLVQAPPPGTKCPVCFCEEEEWHITTSCCHAVCMDCFQGYAKSQVLDPEQSGPLKCPICPQVLRRDDATVALGGDRQLIRQWDLKIRNQLLRALPAFRSCPHCSDETGGGGGFVTPECLAPQYHERREQAGQILHSPDSRFATISLIYFGVCYCISKYPSQSPLVDLFFMMAPLPLLAKTIVEAFVRMAEEARAAFFRPISVECPCCHKSFLLPNETKHMVDEESTRWIGENTRPCPSCSVPIAKLSGCNHMRCSHCQASFCWACMQLRTNCAAYNCRHGAPYRNAVPGVPAQRRPSEEESVLSRTDKILNVCRQFWFLPKWRAEIDVALILLTLFGREFWPLQQIATVIMEFLVTLFASGILGWIVLAYTSWKFWESLQHLYRQRAAMQDAQGVGDIFEPLRQGARGRQRVFMSEQEMLQVALQRSLQEQQHQEGRSEVIQT